jgi:hypothetical protein
MAQVNFDGNSDLLWQVKDFAGNAVFAIFLIGAGTSAFTVFAINSANTTRYFWVDDADDLVYGTTIPTATNSTAINKVGAQS